jgi:hypothetical protein
VDAGTGFEAHAEAVLSELRHAFAALVSAAGTPVRRAVDLQRALDVDAPLAWRVYRVATSADPLLAAPLIPRLSPLRQLLEAAERRGLPASIIARTDAAIAAYIRLLETHAGDREALDTMIAGLRPEEAEQIDAKTRRSAFKLNARIWGMQAATTASLFVLHPTDDPATLGIAVVSGYMSLHAVRPDVPLIARISARLDIDGEGRQIVRPENQLEEFCTPGIEYRHATDDDGKVSTRIYAAGIGRQSAINTFALSRGTAPLRDADDINVNEIVGTPSEMAHLELLAPAGLTDPKTARMTVYGRRSGIEKVHERRPIDRMPLREPVVHHGVLTDVAPETDIPRWPELVRRTLEVIGVYGTQFDVYRCRVPYPVLHTLISLEVDIPGRPEQNS